MRPLKIGNEIINLALVKSIVLKQQHDGEPVLYFSDGAAGDDDLSVFYGDEAKYLWDWLNENIDMTVCQMPEAAQ